MPPDRRNEWIALDDFARARSLPREVVWERIRQDQLAHREVDGVHFVREPESWPRADSMVPSGYAEKAMASLLRLHDELMVEKEARLGLMQKLMEREQALAELKSYVRLLEARLGDEEKRSLSRFEFAGTTPPPGEPPSAPTEPAPAGAAEEVAPGRSAEPSAPPTRPAVTSAETKQTEGWRNW